MEIISYAFTSFLLLVTFSMFIVAYRYPEKKIVLFLSIAILVIIVGLTLETYPEQKIWNSIHNSAPVLIMVVVFEIFSVVVVKSKLAEYAVINIIQKKSDPTFLSIFFIVVTYVFSLFINNLATILVIVPIILMLGHALKLENEPLLVMVIIASNIGGASTMIGDFPNIVISQYCGASFLDFLKYMSFPLLIFIFCSVILYKVIFPRIDKDLFPYITRGKERSRTFSYILNYTIIKKYYKNFMNIRINKDMLWVLVIFIAMILSFIYVRVNPVFIALSFLTIIIVILKIEDDIFKDIDFSVLVWFLALFIIAGAYEHSIQNLGSSMVDSINSPLLMCVMIIVIGTFVTAFLSAGPTTVLLIPLALMLNEFIPNNFAFWSLSLGILAGSSATPIGATAGPVVISHFERFYNKKFSWKEFLKISIPIALALNIFAILYVSIYFIVLL